MSEETSLPLAASALDPEWLKEITAKFGPSVIDLVDKMMKSGMSPAFIAEAFSKLSPLLLDIFAHTFHVSGLHADAAGKLGASAEMDDSILHGPLASFFLDKLIDMLPTFLHGWQLMIAESALKMLKSAIG